MAADISMLNSGAVLDAARLPIAVLGGAETLLLYANPAFCDLVGRTLEQMLNLPFRRLMPNQDVCLLLLQKVYRHGKCETHTERGHAVAEPVFWSYEVWPVLGGNEADGNPVGVVLQVTETGRSNRKAAVMNEALLLSAVRQHELMEQAEVLNNKLTAEIEERQRVEREVERLAFYDSLTDLPNRRLLRDRLHHASVACHRTLQHGAILFIDLDRFKNLNDTRGHHVGDLLLQQVARRLQGCVRENDTVARLGGDEFVVVLEGLSANAAGAHAQAEMIGDKVLASLNQPYLLIDYQYHCTGSIGIGMFSSDRDSVDDLLKRADSAQYRAKSAGGGSLRFFDVEMLAAAGARAALEASLREAVQKRQFRLHYQVQVDEGGAVRGAEALLRWEHPERGLLLPAEFIECAEKAGIVESIGLWVMEAACLQLRDWSRKPETASLTLSVNVSAREFGHPDFVARILTTIDEVGADPTKLILEFTERIMFGPLEETLGKMFALKAQGLCFALDDFGTGYSSLSCLRDLPLSQVKIDRSFVSDILGNYSDGVIAGTVIAMGQSLGLTVIAEGVETEEQHQFLARHGCHMYQGFLFGRPLPMQHLEPEIRRASTALPLH